MPEKKQPVKTTKRDFPLAPTNFPKAVDQTRVSSNYAPVKLPDVVKPAYKYKQADIDIFKGGKPYSKSDSANYEKGFKRGREGDNFPYPSAGKSSYNAGHTEGSEKPKGKTKFIKRK
jgi:hypothetical protein